jgi:hypothetical protein
MSFGQTFKRSCPGGCGVEYEYTDFRLNRPPIPVIPAPVWAIDDQVYLWCNGCGVELNLDQISRSDLQRLEVV